MKKGFPAARVDTFDARSVRDGSSPSSPVASVVACASVSGRNAMVCAPDTRVSAPRYSGRNVMRTKDGVCGMTARKSHSIDSLTASIQCTSSTM